MKIGYLVNIQDIHAQRWINYFKSKGHDIFVITSQATINELDVTQYHIRWGIPMGERYAQSPFRHVFSPISINQIKNIIRKERPDIIHTYYATHYGFIAALTNYHPFLLSVLGSDVLINPEHIIFKYMAKYALKKADCVHCDAEHIKCKSIELGASPEKLKTIYYGTDTNKYAPDASINSLKVKLGIEGHPVIISTRNLDPIYDIESLIKAIPIVLKDFPNAKFLIVGRGSEELKLKDLAKSLGISTNVIFTGFIRNDQLPLYLNSSDIYVSTSLSDGGLAASTAEAMASGLPVVTTDFGENSKWVNDGVNGFLVPLSNPDSLATKIVFLLQNKDERIRFGINGRKIIEEKNDYQKEMAKMEHLYTEMIKH